jgi:hypothetical protein
LVSMIAPCGLAVLRVEIQHDSDNEWCIDYEHSYRTFNLFT